MWIQKVNIKVLSLVVVVIKVVSQLSTLKTDKEHVYKEGQVEKSLWIVPYYLHVLKCKSV